jgi:hypothetical protein
LRNQQGNAPRYGFEGVPERSPFKLAFSVMLKGTSNNDDFVVGDFAAVA